MSQKRSHRRLWSPCERDHDNRCGHVHAIWWGLRWRRTGV